MSLSFLNRLNACNSMRVINCYKKEYFVTFCTENVSLCDFNDNTNSNFFLESVLKIRVRIIHR